MITLFLSSLVEIECSNAAVLCGRVLVIIRVLYFLQIRPKYIGHWPRRISILVYFKSVCLISVFLHSCQIFNLLKIFSYESWFIPALIIEYRIHLIFAIQLVIVWYTEKMRRMNCSLLHSSVLQLEHYMLVHRLATWSNFLP